jgi:hypothetical protein
MDVSLSVSGQVGLYDLVPGITIKLDTEELMVDGSCGQVYLCSSALLCPHWYLLI